MGIPEHAIPFVSALKFVTDWELLNEVWLRSGEFLSVLMFETFNLYFLSFGISALLKITGLLRFFSSVILLKIFNLFASPSWEGSFGKVEVISRSSIILAPNIISLAYFSSISGFLISFLFGIFSISFLTLSLFLT